MLSQTLPTPKMCSSLKFSGWGKKKQISLASCYTVREACCLLTWSHFPLWKKKKSQAQKGSFCTELCTLGGRQDMGKVKLLSLAFFSAANLGYFCSRSELDLFHWTLRLLQVPLICVSLLNLGEDGRKLLFFHFDYVSSITHGFKFSLHPLKFFSNKEY